MIAYWIVSRNEERRNEEDIYGEDSREELLEGDELTPEEEGFMKGYMDS